MSDTASPRVTRRGLLKAAINLTIATLLTGTGTVAYASEVEPRWVALERLRVPIPGLPPAFDGYRIAQLSDLHLGPTTRPDTIARAVQMAVDLAPNLILLTGDFVSERLDAPDLLAKLRPLQARDGVLAIMGNHDHWVDVGGVRQVLADLGLPELRNASRPTLRGGAALWIAGVDDIWEKQHDLTRALADVPPDAVTILLAHEPDYADEVAPLGRVALQLSGHSHGGQVRIPGVGALALPYLAHKYPIGLRRVGEMALYTSRGVGNVAPAVRFNCRPEVTEITLRRG